MNKPSGKIYLFAMFTKQLLQSYQLTLDVDICVKPFLLTQVSITTFRFYFPPKIYTASCSFSPLKLG
jgi:hypothetical protein